MGFLGKITNKDVKVKGIKDDVMYSETIVERNYTLFGISMFKTYIVENINKHAEFFDSEEDSGKSLGFKRK